MSNLALDFLQSRRMHRRFAITMRPFQDADARPIVAGIGFL
jgi:hypothetical protein